MSGIRLPAGRQVVPVREANNYECWSIFWWQKSGA
jgi:hypothetical protein